MVLGHVLLMTAEVLVVELYRQWHVRDIVTEQSENCSGVWFGAGNVVSVSRL